MKVLYGWQRKLALIPLSFLVLGWVLYSIGFILDLVDEAHLLDPKSPTLFSWYVLLIGGPFVYFLGVLQAVLPGTASSIVGIPTAFVSAVYLVSAGELTYVGVWYFTELVNGDGDDVTFNARSFVAYLGALIITVSWCFVMMLSVSYKSLPRRNDNYQPFDHTPDGRVSRRWHFTSIIARCLSIPFIILSAVGWCFITTAFVRPDSNDLEFDSTFGTYGAVIIGPLLFLAGLLHAVCSGGASTIMGVFSSILNTLYTVFVGYLVFGFGELFYDICHIDKINCSVFHSSLDINWIYAFSGGVASLFFWTTVLALRPFYCHHSERVDQQSSDSIINSSNPPHYGYGTLALEESFSNSNRNTA